MRNPKRKAGGEGADEFGGRAECEFDGSKEEVEVLARPRRSSGWLRGPSHRKGCVGECVAPEGYNIKLIASPRTCTCSSTPPLRHVDEPGETPAPGGFHLRNLIPKIKTEQKKPQT